ncbi:phytanoyl- dioxygenase [Ophiostoma piceae UAMH 11346]|uniref:Phytanoyl-dioxygenase n=1 Tax=Ophiostoma piceae (strain UAMH 11346) TaxID=1262450 RepID=S3BX53_OPHP1|nr:phytanoyl- dioxygenase [Ophiostoma piceae UAMH 11346]
MAPSAITPDASPVLKPAPMGDAIKSKIQSKQWLADLHRDGFVVVKSAIPRDRALGYQAAAHKWLTSFGTALDLENPDTWTKDNLPAQSKINTFHGYCVTHEKFVWDARTEPDVLDVFATIWDTDELLVSFDALNITLPNRRDVPRKPAWEHVDQSPLRQGLHCVQGILSLSPSGPEDGGLVVYPGSQNLFREFFDTQTDKSTWKPADSFLHTPEHLAWFAARGCKPHKVIADVGDLILWDSRTVHYGSEPSETSQQIRTIVYAAYTPAKLATPEQLEIKKEVFQNYGSTTHWPHDNIRQRPTKTFLADGTRDPRDRDEPLEKPEYTDKLLKLAGVKAY